MPRYHDIKPYTNWGNYAVDVPLLHIARTIEGYQADYKLLLEPDFQRGHVWTDEQRVKFIEHLLREGVSGRDIFFNCASWNVKATEEQDKEPMVLVDGLQRLTACIGYVNNEVPAFGCFCKEYTDRLRAMTGSLKFHVNNLLSRKEVLEWYLDLNSGGVVHSQEELERVRKLLEQEQK